MSNISTLLGKPYRSVFERFNEMPAITEELSETQMYVGWYYGDKSGEADAKADSKWIIMKMVADNPPGTYTREETRKWAEGKRLGDVGQLKWNSRASYTYKF